MSKFAVISGLVPWIAFTVASQRIAADGVAWSAAIAVVLTVLLLVDTVRHGRGSTVLSLGSLVLFGFIAGVGFVGDAGVDAWLYRWAPSLVGVVLGLYVVATAWVKPFTEDYARLTVPEQYWDSPRFRRANRVLSSAWGVALVVIGLSGMLAAAIGTDADDATQPFYLELLLNWVVPIGVIVGMVRFTEAYRSRARAEAATSTDTSMLRPS